MLYHAMLCYSRLSYAILLCNTMLYHAMVYFYIMCYTMVYYYMLCYTMLLKKIYIIYFVFPSLPSSQWQWHCEALWPHHAVWRGWRGEIPESLHPACSRVALQVSMNEEQQQQHPLINTRLIQFQSTDRRAIKRKPEGNALLFTI